MELKSGDIKYILEGILIILAVSCLFYGNIFAIVIFSPYVILHVKIRQKERDKKERLLKTKKFKDGLLSVSFALNVGYSIENSFNEAVGELRLLYGDDSDIVEEFSMIVNRIRRNENLEDVLWEYAHESGIDDIKYFAEIFRYAKRSGGDMNSIIKRTASSISEKTEVLGEIETIISGKRMEQRVMSMVPFFVILYLKFTSPEFISCLYGNVAGVIIMTVCLGIYIVSVCIARRVVQIDV
ncbi:MAG: type II secretion system F family protein [Lachnospira sp.]